MSQPTPNQPAGSNPSDTYYQQPAAEDPGKTLGIVGLVLAFIAPPIGLIISAVARSKSKKAGFKNTPALVGVILGAVFTVIYIVVFGVVIAGGMALANQCAQLGPGEHNVNGVTVKCGS